MMLLAVSFLTLLGGVHAQVGQSFDLQLAADYNFSQSAVYNYAGYSLAMTIGSDQQSMQCILGTTRL